ncbi:MAG: aspartyl/asparaginyl beta-hydroxylase domain-containing protein [Pseudomonadota bacterium]
MLSIAELEDQANECSKRGDMASLQRICQQILTLDDGHLPSLKFLSDIALQKGEFSQAEALLRTMLVHSPGDPQLHALLGQALYRQGQLEKAAESYEACRRLQPNKGLLYLTLGNLYLEMENVDKAVQIFSLGETVQNDLLQLWARDKTPPGVAHMSKTAWQALCRHHTDMHLAAVASAGDSAATARIRDARWPLIDTRDIAYPHGLYRPNLFFIEYDQNPGFFKTEAFPWAQALEQQFPRIRGEILASLDVSADGRPYLGAGNRLEGEQWKPLVNRMNWASVHLYKGGVANKPTVEKFPSTLAALESVPLATAGDGPSEVFVSVLAPNTQIPAHHGVSNAILTVHLPILVPEGCGLTVHDETREPEEGKLLVFDDSWEHSAWNNSREQRVVLIFEIWHPALSAAERHAVLCSLEARKQWLQGRSP